MSSPQDQWEDVTAKAAPQPVTPAGPFAHVAPVDGYAFTQDPVSPELRYQQMPKADAPAIPVREAPQRIRDQVRVSGVWQPGGSAHTPPPALRMPRPNIIKAILSGLIPLTLLGGGIYLVMRLYGLN